jgi:succinate dehydrogenase / fumarate reductase iron-sulfur subunit
MAKKAKAAKTDYTQKVKFVVNSFDPNTESFSRSARDLNVTNLTTVLDALIGINESEDKKISMRYSCRMGICGSCAMVINGRPALACETNVLREQSNTITVEPMHGHPILRGLVTDFDDFFEHHKAMKPWIMRNNPSEKYSHEKEFMQTDAQRDNFLPFSECIKCGLCVDACPVSNINKNFAGPQALAQAYRYYADSKDQAGDKRLEYLDTGDNVWGCEFSGSCSKVCPKSVDPAFAIQLLKTAIAKKRADELFSKKDEV